MPSSPDIQQSDQAVKMFNEVFGQGWHELLWTQSMDGGPASIIFPILQGFNLFVLLGISALLIYVVGHGLIGSSHEGKFMGSKLHSIWVPVRGVMSVSMLCPIPWAKGLSLIQVVILAFVGFSIQGANAVMDKGMDFLDENRGSVISLRTYTRDNAERLSSVILDSLVVQYHQIYFQDDDSGIGDTAYTIKEDTGTSGFTNFPGKGVDTKKANIDDSVYIIQFTPPKGLEKSDMGTIVIPKTGDILGQDLLNSLRLDCVERLIEDIAPIAESIVKYKHPEYNDFSPQPMPGTDEFDMAIHVYVESMNEGALAATDAVEYNNEIQGEMHELHERINQQGFYALGQYYWTLTRMNKRVNELLHVDMKMTNVNQEALQTKTSPVFNEILSTLELARNYEQITFAEKAEVALYGQSRHENSARAFWDKITNVISTPMRKLSEWGIAAITNEDPVIGLASLGHEMIITGEVVFIGYLAFKGTKSISALGKGSKLAKSFGFGMGGGGDGSFMGPLLLPILTLVGSLFFLGLVLAYYLPSLPFILWMTSFISWFILVIEALVAGPLWAAAHAVPEGEGIAGQHGKQGYLLFMHVLMYPILLVVSFFIAILGIHVLSYIGEGFRIFFQGYMGQHDYFSITAAVASIFLAGIVMVIFTHKLFGIIGWIPQHVFKWLGGSGHSLADDKEEQKVNAAFGVFAQRSERMTQPLEKGGQQKIENKMKAGSGKKGSGGVSG